MSFQVGQLTIPLFVGTVMNWTLLGALAVQVYLYFLAFPKDRRTSKFLVAFIVVAEILQTLGDSRDTMRIFGAGWGNGPLLDEVGWAWFSVPILGSLIAAVGQLFFAWRIYILGNRTLFIPAVIVIVNRSSSKLNSLLILCHADYHHPVGCRHMDRCVDMPGREILRVGISVPAATCGLARSDCFVRCGYRRRHCVLRDEGQAARIPPYSRLGYSDS
ncbi:hypothetical protein B0H11DRAFT_1858312 [Mycena galericulata]|nr:hypothetical protein B0H11DRAFT_1858312 [Mycena galericulata]